MADKPWEKAAKVLQPKPWEKAATSQPAPAVATPTDAGNPYAQADTVYDPVTGVPLYGSYASVTPETKTGPLDALLTGAAKGLTFGLVDEGISAIGAEMDRFNKTSGSGDAALAYADTARKEYPGTALVGEMAGMATSPASLFKPGGGFWAQVGKGLGTGAILGGGYGATTADEGERLQGGLMGGAIGGVLGGAIPAITAGGKAILEALPVVGTNARLSRMAEGAPTTDIAKATAQDVLTQAEQMGQTVPQSQFPGLKIIGEFADTLDTLPGQTNTPGGIRLAENINAAAANPGGVSPEIIKKLRESASELSAELSPTFAPTRDARAGAAAVGAIDDFIATLPEGTTYKQGLELWKQYMKSRDMDRIAEKSGNYLSNETSGVRNMLKSLLNSKNSRTYTPEEKALLQRVIKGTPVEQALRTAGSGLGRLFGMGTGVATGGNPIAGAAAGYGVSKVAESAADAMTMRNLEIARALLAKGGFRGVPEIRPEIMSIINSLMQRGSRAASGGQQ